MIVVVTGDREWTNPDIVIRRLSTLQSTDTLVHGAARGLDTMAGVCATEMGLTVHAMPADWTAHGRAAGPIRNRAMVDTYKPDLVLAFHDDITQSKGTLDMVMYVLTKTSCPIELWAENGLVGTRTELYRYLVHK